jgi:hypothetical protein
MKGKSMWATLLCLAAIAILALAAAPAQAIVGGQFDGNDHPNVGMVCIDLGEGHWGFMGTCTLVDEHIVLTAAHVVDWVVREDAGVENVFVTFDPLVDPAATRYYASSIEVNPIWWTAPALWNNSKSRALGPGNEDEALVWLAESVTGITPAKIVAADGMNGLDLTSSAFTVVGFGLNAFVSGNAMSWRNPQTQWLYNGRYYKDVSAITEHDLFPDRYVKITASLGYGDSGGPLFHEGVQVAINVAGLSYRCVAPDYSYRLDAPLAHEFLTQHLDPSSFVALP